MKIVLHDSAEKFVRSIKKPTIAKVLRTINLLEEYGQELGMPHVKSLKAGLFELRIRGKQEIRLFFVFRNKRVIILHGFVKKSQKTPNSEIEIAKKRQGSLD